MSKTTVNILLKVFMFPPFYANDGGFPRRRPSLYSFFLLFFSFFLRFAASESFFTKPPNA